MEIQMIPLLLAYFAAGAFREAACVSYYRAVSRRRHFAVSGLAGGLELWDFLVLALIIQSGWSVPLIAAYTLGVMAGTFVASKWGK
jgi:hypothetical protein